MPKEFSIASMIGSAAILAIAAAGCSTNQEVRALAKNEDAVLKLKLLRYDVSFLGSKTYRSREYWAILAFVTAYWPGWWIANEDYRCDIEIEATLVGASSEKTLLRQVFKSGEEP